MFNNSAILFVIIPICFAVMSIADYLSDIVLGKCGASGARLVILKVVVWLTVAISLGFLIDGMLI